MQIYHGGHGPAIRLPVTSPGTSNSRPASVRGEADGQTVGGVEIVGVPAERLTSLANRLREIPTTRDDVIQQVRERIEQGEYLTRNAAERTAFSLSGT